MFLENTLNFNKQTGWIEVVCGSMFSGKTEELIRRIRRAQFANLGVIIFKPKHFHSHSSSSNEYIYHEQEYGNSKTQLE